MPSAPIKLHSYFYQLTSCINLVKSSVMMKVSHHSPNLALCEEHRFVTDLPVILCENK